VDFDIYFATALLIIILVVASVRFFSSRKRIIAKQSETTKNENESNIETNLEPFLLKLDEGHKQELVNLAKEAIAAFVRSGELINFESQDPVLNQTLGVFVTLRKREALRGCIGQLRSDDPLYQTVKETAVSAASRDPRFPPVSNAELNELSIKISILSPLEPVEDVSEIEVGVHGVMIIHAGHRGILLPQVPVERGWDRKTFLENVCLKAGLPPDTWKEKPELYSFTSLDFGEN
jgi:AmmeMemoRadiSam system protein A